jgi:hypothetical protein
MKCRAWVSVLLSLPVAMVASRPAWADQLQPGEEEPQPRSLASLPPFGPAPSVPPTVSEAPAPWVPPSSIGTGIQLGGGLWTFVDGEAYERTGIGGSWEARLTLGTRRIVGAEVAYVGSANDIRGQGVFHSNYLLRNGAEGALRLSAPLVRGTGLIAPFVFGGAGWNRYRVVNAGPHLTGMLFRDDVAVLPVGAGVTLAFRTLLFDLRATYRPTFDDELFAGAPMQAWNVGVSVGAEL